MFLPVLPHHPSVPPDEQAWRDLCGLVGSAVKFALVAEPEKVECFNLMVGGLGEDLSERLMGNETEEIFPMR